MKKTAKKDPHAVIWVAYCERCGKVLGVKEHPLLAALWLPSRSMATSSGEMLCSNCFRGSTVIWQAYGAQ